MTKSAGTIVVLGIVSDDQGNFLLIRRCGEDKWLFPGGKVDCGESQEQAVVREVMEETGICCHLPCFVGVRTHPDSQRVIGYWLCKASSKDINIQREQEIADARWWSGRDAVTILGATLYEPVRKLLLSERNGR